MTNTNNVIPFPKSMFPVFTEEQEPKYRFGYEIVDNETNNIQPYSKLMTVPEATRYFSSFLDHTSEVYFSVGRFGGLFDIGTMSISSVENCVYAECDSVYAIEVVASNLKKQLNKKTR